MPTHRHQAKRPYQPSITSFFNRSGDGTLDHDPQSSLRPGHQGHHHAAPADDCPRPLLPAAVQASLLNVGMRVRKAVPEGYQTTTMTKKKLVGGGGASAAAAAAASGVRKSTTGEVAPNSRRRSTALASASAVAAGAGAGVYAGHQCRELTPFCGLLKVGGYDPPPPTSSPPGVGDVPALLRWDEEEEEEAERNGQPLMRQDSMVSDYCSDDDDDAYGAATDTFTPADVVNPLKRRQLDFGDDEDDDEGNGTVDFATDPDAPSFNPEDAMGSPFSTDQRSHLAPPHAPTPVAQGRVLRSCCPPSKAALNARQRGGPEAAGGSGPGYAPGHCGNAASASPLDFGDAPFLQPSEFATYTEDSLMSGI